MINPCVSSLTKSATLKITALTKKLISEGKDVVNFAAGEPDFDTPKFIKDEAKKALDEGFTKYTPSSGIPSLREAIRLKLQKENKISLTSDNIIVTPGAKYALYVALLTLLKAGDKVIIPSPYWVSYPEMVKLCGAKVQFLSTVEENNFKIRVEDLKKALTSGAKVLILNYPNNPTGVTYSSEELEAFYSVIKGRNVFVISDEIYETLVYDGREHISFASLGDSSNITLTINGFSKTFSMTGWRLGYLAGPEKIINAASKIIDHTTSCACAISQRAGLAALKNNKEWQIYIRDIFQKRRNLLWEGLKSCGKLTPLKSEGTFYMFCNIKETGLTSFDFSSKLLEKHLVSCIPADVFGKEGFVRFSFATSTEQISKGIDRIKDFLKQR